MTLYSAHDPFCPVSREPDSSVVNSPSELKNNEAIKKKLNFIPQNPSTSKLLPSTAINFSNIAGANSPNLIAKRSSMKQQKPVDTLYLNNNIGDNKGYLMDIRYSPFNRTYSPKTPLISLGNQRFFYVKKFLDSDPKNHFHQQSVESTDFKTVSRRSSATQNGVQNLSQFSSTLNESQLTLLNRSLSSPELLSVPLYGSTSSSMVSSPIPTTGDVSALPLHFRYPSIQKTQIHQKYSSSNESLKNQERFKRKRASADSDQTSKKEVGFNTLQRPQVQLNGSILSIGNAQLMESANKLMEQYSTCARRQSIGSAHSESKRNILLLQNVGRKLQRTHSHLKKTRLLHAFYLFALPIYTVFGAFVFQALDGTHDDNLTRLYAIRCQEQRHEKLDQMRAKCIESGSDFCFSRMRELLNEIEICYRNWHETNKPMTHPMSDFTNAIIYAFSVYTTIGYASTVAARIATVIYGAFGIPLFFAFIKEEGNHCRMCFIWVYNRVKKWQTKNCKNFSTNRAFGLKTSKTIVVEAKEKPKISESTDIVIKMEEPLVNSTNTKFDDPEIPINTPISPKRNFTKKCDSDAKSKHADYCNHSRCTKNQTQSANWQQRQKRLNYNAREQKRVFISGVVVFILYLVTVSGLFAMMTGFGDVFPSESSIILINMFFIVLGVVLFSMCYFILQEEIRAKAFEASRKARMSISKYSHSLMLHTKNPWSRRNSPAFDDRNSPYPGSGGSASGGATVSGSAFDRLRKRRQSAPVIGLDDETAKELAQKVAKTKELYS